MSEMEEERLMLIGERLSGAITPERSARLDRLNTEMARKYPRVLQEDLDALAEMARDMDLRDERRARRRVRE